MRFLIIVACVGCVLFFAGSLWAKKLREGNRAPNFALRDSEDREFSLQKTLNEGLWVVLVFYPKDSSTVCTKQLCRIRDLMPNIPEWIKVVGISSGDADSHREFVRAHNLTFPLLIDTKNRVRKLLGANAWGGRVTIIINPEGRITKICTDMLSLEEHIGIIEDLVNQNS